MKIYIYTLLILLTSLSMNAQNLADHAEKFLNSLDATQKAKAQYTFDDNERFNFHFIPRARNGISLNELNPTQRDAALALLKASLSEQGFKKATAIMELENALREVEGRSSSDKYRDPLNYYFTIFGTPSSVKPWGWRLEGHHITQNFSSVNASLESSTPSFFGSNPAIVPQGAEKGKQVLKQETELGFALVNSLTSDQLAKARFSETAPSEIITGNNRHANELTPKGLGLPEMTEAQKKQFLQLLDVYVKNYAFGFSSRLMDKIKKAGIENLSFAWAGSLKPGAGHYYRIQGPILLIEYDNTQNNANHVHSIVRDLTNDFAEDILREHYEKEHTAK
ncbi:MAG TPA: DUF3500 domain-containing protein [Cyclobacteriaceae bacterium]|nr:DUF3500 domain-containing protein [Cyclobacteriaceae bacterium]